AMADPAFVEPLHGLVERGLGERERDMMDTPGVGWRPPRVGHPLLVREHRDQPAVAGVEVKVALGRIVEIRLLEHEGHAEHALPEVDRCPPVSAHDRDVVHALALQLPHRPQWWISFDLYSLRCRLPHGTSSTCICTTSTSRSLSRISSASAASAAPPSASSTE